MKLRLLKLTPEQLIRALQGKPSELNLPSDMELLDVKYDAFNRQVTAVVRSDSFEDVAESMPIPEFILNAPQPASTSVSAPAAAPKAPAPPPAPVSPQKSLLSTLTATQQPAQPTVSASLGSGIKTLAPKPEASQDTGGLEGEFTKDQRKLLRFAVDGDFVIVKPTQFLKTEWEDINDTVKSIGGQWVKGDIINYWVIPKNPKPQSE